MTLADGLQINRRCSVSEARTKGKQLFFTLLLLHFSSDFAPSVVFPSSPRAEVTSLDPAVIVTVKLPSFILSLCSVTLLFHGRDVPKPQTSSNIIPALIGNPAAERGDGMWNSLCRCCSQKIQTR